MPAVTMESAATDLDNSLGVDVADVGSHAGSPSNIVQREVADIWGDLQRICACQTLTPETDVMWTAASMRTFNRSPSG